MTCEELVRHLSDYIDGELDEPLWSEAEAHLADCDRCPVVLGTTRRTVALLRQVGRRSIPADRRQAILDRVRKALS